MFGIAKDATLVAKLEVRMALNQDIIVVDKRVVLSKIACYARMPCGFVKNGVMILELSSSLLR